MMTLRAPLLAVLFLIAACALAAPRDQPGSQLALVHWANETFSTTVDPVQSPQLGLVFAVFAPAFGNASVVAVDATTGTERWAKQLPIDTTTRQPVAVKRIDIVFGSTRDVVIAVTKDEFLGYDAVHGGNLWSAPIPAGLGALVTLLPSTSTRSAGTVPELSIADSPAAHGIAWGFAFTSLPGEFYTGFHLRLNTTNGHIDSAVACNGGPVHFVLPRYSSTAAHQLVGCNDSAVLYETVTGNVMAAAAFNNHPAGAGATLFGPQDPMNCSDITAASNYIPMALTALPESTGAAVPANALQLQRVIVLDVAGGKVIENTVAAPELAFRDTQLWCSGRDGVYGVATKANHSAYALTGNTTAPLRQVWADVPTSALPAFTRVGLTRFTSIVAFGVFNPAQTGKPMQPVFAARDFLDGNILESWYGDSVESFSINLQNPAVDLVYTPHDQSFGGLPALYGVSTINALTATSFALALDPRPGVPSALWTTNALTGSPRLARDLSTRSRAEVGASLTVAGAVATVVFNTKGESWRVNRQAKIVLSHQQPDTGVSFVLWGDKFQCFDRRGNVLWSNDITVPEIYASVVVVGRNVLLLLIGTDATARLVAFDRYSGKLVRTISSAIPSSCFTTDSAGPPTFYTLPETGIAIAVTDFCVATIDPTLAIASVPVPGIKTSFPQQLIKGSLQSAASSTRITCWTSGGVFSAFDIIAFNDTGVVPKQQWIVTVPTSWGINPRFTQVVASTTDALLYVAGTSDYDWAWLGCIDTDGGRLLFGSRVPDVTHTDAYHFAAYRGFAVAMSDSGSLKLIGPRFNASTNATDLHVAHEASFSNTEEDFLSLVVRDDVALIAGGGCSACIIAMNLSTMTVRDVPLFRGRPGHQFDEAFTSADNGRVVTTTYGVATLVIRFAPSPRIVATLLVSPFAYATSDVPIAANAAFATSRGIVNPTVEGYVFPDEDAPLAADIFGPGTPPPPPSRPLPYTLPAGHTFAPPPTDAPPSSEAVVVNKSAPPLQFAWETSLDVELHVADGTLVGGLICAVDQRSAKLLAVNGDNGIVRAGGTVSSGTIPVLADPSLGCLVFDPSLQKATLFTLSNITWTFGLAWTSPKITVDAFSLQQPFVARNATSRSSSDATFVLQTGGNYIVIDASTGKVLASQKIPDISSYVEYLGNGFASYHYGSENTKQTVVFISAMTGTRVTTWDTPATGASVTTSCVADGVSGILFVAFADAPTASPQLYAVRPADASIAWNHSALPNGARAPFQMWAPVPADATAASPAEHLIITAFSAAGDGMYVIGYDKATGDDKWSQDSSRPAPWVPFSQATGVTTVQDGKLDRAHLAIVVAWQNSTDQPANAFAPVYLEAFAISDGSLAWSLDGGTHVQPGAPTYIVLGAAHAVVSATPLPKSPFVLGLPATPGGSATVVGVDSNADYSSDSKLKAVSRSAFFIIIPEVPGYGTPFAAIAARPSFEPAFTTAGQLVTSEGDDTVLYWDMAGRIIYRQDLPATEGGAVTTRWTATVIGMPNFYSTQVFEIGGGIVALVTYYDLIIYDLDTGALLSTLPLKGLDVCKAPSPNLNQQQQQQQQGHESMASGRRLLQQSSVSFVHIVDGSYLVLGVTSCMWIAPVATIRQFASAGLPLPLKPLQLPSMNNGYFTQDWTDRVDPSNGHPTVVLSLTDGNAFEVDVVSVEIVWSTRATALPFGSYDTISPVAIAGPYALTHVSSGLVTCVYAPTGAVLWQQTIPDAGNVAAGIAVLGTMAFVSPGDELYAFNIEPNTAKGEKPLRWTTPSDLESCPNMQTDPQTTSPAPSSFGTVLAVVGCHLQAFNISTGDAMWPTPVTVGNAGCARLQVHGRVAIVECAQRQFIIDAVLGKPIAVVQGSVNGFVVASKNADQPRAVIVTNPSNEYPRNLASVFDMRAWNAAHPVPTSPMPMPPIPANATIAPNRTEPPTPAPTVGPPAGGKVVPQPSEYAVASVLSAGPIGKPIYRGGELIVAINKSATSFQGAFVGLHAPTGRVMWTSPLPAAAGCQFGGSSSINGVIGYTNGTDDYLAIMCNHHIDAYALEGAAGMSHVFAAVPGPAVGTTFAAPLVFDAATKTVCGGVLAPLGDVVDTMRCIENAVTSYIVTAPPASGADQCQIVDARSVGLGHLSLALQCPVGYTGKTAIIGNTVDIKSSATVGVNAEVTAQYTGPWPSWTADNEFIVVAAKVNATFSNWTVQRTVDGHVFDAFVLEAALDSTARRPYSIVPSAENAGQLRLTVTSQSGAHGFAISNTTGQPLTSARWAAPFSEQIYEPVPLTPMDAATGAVSALASSSVFVGGPGYLAELSIETGTQIMVTAAHGHRSVSQVAVSAESSAPVAVVTGGCSVLFVNSTTGSLLAGVPTASEVPLPCFVPWFTPEFATVTAALDAFGAPYMATVPLTLLNGANATMAADVTFGGSALGDISIVGTDASRAMASWTFGNAVYAMNMDSLDLLWGVTSPMDSVLGADSKAMVIALGPYVLLPSKGGFWALNATTGDTAQVIDFDICDIGRPEPYIVSPSSGRASHQAVFAEGATPEPVVVMTEGGCVHVLTYSPQTKTVTQRRVGPPRQNYAAHVSGVIVALTATSGDSAIRAFDPATGAVKWTTSAPDIAVANVMINGPIFSGDVAINGNGRYVVVASADGTFMQLDHTTGAIVSLARLPATHSLTGMIPLAGTTMLDDMLFLSAKSSVIAVRLPAGAHPNSSTADVVWAVASVGGRPIDNSGTQTNPVHAVIVDTELAQVYVRANTGIVAVDVTSGSVRWDLTASLAVRSEAIALVADAKGASVLMVSTAVGSSLVDRVTGRTFATAIGGAVDVQGPAALLDARRFVTFAVTQNDKFAVTSTVVDFAAPSQTQAPTLPAPESSLPPAATLPAPTPLRTLPTGHAFVGLGCVAAVRNSAPLFVDCVNSEVVPTVAANRHSVPCDATAEALRRCTRIFTDAMIVTDCRPGAAFARDVLLPQINGSASLPLCRPAATSECTRTAGATAMCSAFAWVAPNATTLTRDAAMPPGVALPPAASLPPLNPLPSTSAAPTTTSTTTVTPPPTTTTTIHPTIHPHTSAHTTGHVVTTTHPPTTTPSPMPPPTPAGPTSHPILLRYRMRAVVPTSKLLATQLDTELHKLGYAGDITLHVLHRHITGPPYELEFVFVPPDADRAYNFVHSKSATIAEAVGAEAISFPGAGAKTDEPNDFTGAAIALIVVSVILVTAGISLAVFFARRRYIARGRGGFLGSAGNVQDDYVASDGRTPNTPARAAGDHLLDRSGGGGYGAASSPAEGQAGGGKGTEDDTGVGLMRRGQRSDSARFSRHELSPRDEDRGDPFDDRE